MNRPGLPRLSPQAKAWLSYGGWILSGVILALGLISFVARTFVVHGVSMEPTLRNGDLVLTNKIAQTLAALGHTEAIPHRGALVVFRNPFYNQGDPDMFIVKRAIGLPGDRVMVQDGRIRIHPAGPATYSFNPDDGLIGPQSPTDGTVDRTVPDGELFVVGDNRPGENSLDSRNGMSTVPLRDVQGTVLLRFWPLNSFRIF